MSFSTLHESLVRTTLEDTPGTSGSFAWLDVASLVLVLLCIVLGARRGTWWQLVRLLGLVATLAVARAIAPRFSEGLTNVVGFTPQMSNGILWSAILVLGLIVVALVGRLGKLVLEGAQLGALDRAGGALLGALSGVLLVAGLVVCAAQIASGGWSERNLRSTRTQGLVDTLARTIPGALDPLARERATSEVYAADHASK